MPSLSERFFSGTTGRGRVIGNPDLDPEYTYDFDIGISNYSDRHFLSLHSFYNKFDGYIDRVEIEDNVFTFTNVTSGQIYGVELEGQFNLTENMLFSWNAAWINGEDNNGQELNDIPPNQVFFEYLYMPGNWQFGLQLRSLFEKNQVGSNEKKTPGANLFATSISYRMNQHLSLFVTGENLFNERYFNSADRKSALEPGRSFGVKLQFSL